MAGDEDFAAAFGSGPTGLVPSRLALVTVLQRAENLTDRQAAESVRTRIDWQYLLGLRLDDAGFAHTVLAEFRARVAGVGLEQVVLDALLERLVSEGLVKAGGKQRTDSTHVVAAVAALHRLELAGGSVRAALEALVAAHPAWLEQRICVSDFARRDGTPMTSWRPPPSQARRDELAVADARDGYALLEAVDDGSSPGWLRELPAVDVLRQVLLHNSTRTITAAGREVIRRRENEPEAMVSRPAMPGSPPPMTPTPGGASSARSSGWATSCTSPRPATTPGPAPAAPSPRHSRPPRGTPARAGAATSMTGSTARAARSWCSQPDHQRGHHRCHRDRYPDDRAGPPRARGQEPDPGRHYADSGYLSAELVVSALKTHGIALTGPLLADTSAQARAGNGYARADFAIDYDAKTVTCPQGKTSVSWTPCTQRGKDAIVATFSARDCGPARPAACAPPAARNDGVLPRGLAEAQAAARAAETTIPFQADYARRAGVEAP